MHRMPKIKSLITNKRECTTKGGPQEDVKTKLKATVGQGTGTLMADHLTKSTSSPVTCCRCLKYSDGNWRSAREISTANSRSNYSLPKTASVCSTSNQPMCRLDNSSPFTLILQRQRDEERSVQPASEMKVEVRSLHESPVRYFSEQCVKFTPISFSCQESGESLCLG